jgi:hypothetical protein
MNPGYDVADAIRGNLTQPTSGKDAVVSGAEGGRAAYAAERRGEIVWPRGVTSPA